MLVFYIHIIGLLSTVTDKVNQLHGGLKKVKLEEINSHKISSPQKFFLNQQSGGNLVKTELIY